MTQAHSQPKAFSLSFRDFKILKLDFEINNNFNEPFPEEFQPGLGIACNYDGEKTCLVFLKIWTKDQLPYSFELIATGLFQFNEKPEMTLLKSSVSINCPAIMYPYVRETIADITRRAGFQALHLPPVNFVNLKIEPKIEVKMPEKLLEA